MTRLRQLDSPHWAFLVFVTVTVLSVVPAGYLRLSRANITGEIVAQSLSFTVGDDLTAAVAVDFSPAQVQLSSFTTAQPVAPPLRSDVTFLTARADHLRLSEIGVARQGTLELILVPGARRQIDIRVGGSGSGTAGHGGSYTLDPVGPLQLRFPGQPDQVVPQAESGPLAVASDGTPPGPLRLVATLPSPPTPPTQLPGQANEALTDVLDSVSASSIRFGRPDSSSSPHPFVSSIVRGKLVLVDVSETLSLDSGSPLSLVDFKGYVISVGLGTDGLHVSFTGNARQVKLGPIGFDEDKTPTLLGTWSHLQSVRLACAAILAMAGSLSTVLAPSRRKAPGNRPAPSDDVG